MKGDIKLPFGKRDGRILHITEVKNGLNCNCTCPKCETPLIARNQGKKKIPHFAHYETTDCPGSLESAIHLMAKQVIKDELLIYTPKYSKETKVTDDNGKFHFGESTHVRSSKLEIDRVELEVSKEGFRPDVIAFKNEKSLNIEIKVTHEVDERKKSLVKTLQDPMLEIDLSSLREEVLLNMDQFIWEVTQNVDNKKWVNNPKGEKIYKKNLKKLRLKVKEINKKISAKKERNKERKAKLEKRRAAREKKRAKHEIRIQELREKKRAPHLVDLLMLKKAQDSAWRTKQN